NMIVNKRPLALSRLLLFIIRTTSTMLYILSLHDALPIFLALMREGETRHADLMLFPELSLSAYAIDDLLLQDALLDGVEEGLARSEEHTSELQSTCNLVCRPLLEKKNATIVMTMSINETR